MKHLKIIGLAVVAAAALMAFAGSASAATLTSPAGTAYTGTLESTATESLLLKAGFANITCTESTVSGTIEAKNNNEEHATGAITTLTYKNCGSATVDVLKNLGSLTVKKGSGGEVTGKESEVTVSVLGTSCVYGTSTGTSLGKLTSGTPASLTISAKLPKISGGFACANPAEWSGKYTVTKPGTLIAD